MLPTEEPKSSRRRWIIIGILLAVIATLLYFLHWHHTAQTAATAQAGGKGDASKRASAVGVATAKLGDIDVFQSGLGTAVPRNVVTVHTRVDGELIRVLFKEGQMVKGGDLLAEIDPRPYQVLLTQAEGQMARDAALLKNSQVDFERYKTLLAQDSTSKQQLDTQAATVRQNQGSVESDKGQVGSAKLQLVYSRITAPISGRVGLRLVDAGNIVHAADANGILVITQVQPMTVVFAIPETRVAPIMTKMRAGVAVPVEAWDRDNKSKLASGALAAVDNQVDVTTGTVKLRAEFPNGDYALFPNQFVNARALVDTRHQVVIVPTAAVQVGNAGSFVYAVQDGKTVSVRNVTTGPAQGTNTSIEKGLNAGDVVVIDGVDKLRDGAPVQTISRDAAQAAAARGTEGTAQPNAVPSNTAPSNADKKRRHRQPAGEAVTPSGG
jgi:membrane fusion protein, multidrug efflux system